MTAALFGIDYRDSAGALAHITPADIKSFQGGASFVIEYIGGAAGQGNNALTAANASALESAGLSIVSVYENRPLSGGGMSDTDSSGDYTSAWVDYFSQAGRGTTDAQAAISGAISAGQLTGAIYFAIDLDPAKSTDATTGLNRISETAALNLIDQYFQEISVYFNTYNQLHGTSYQIGVYGAGDTLSKIASDPLVMSDGSHALTWLAGASSWAGSNTFTTWDIKQYDNDQFQLDGRNVDLDQSSGLDFGAWGPTLNNAAAINDVYISVLQRPATTAEQNHWIAQDASIGNAAVIADIVSLPEAQFNIFPVVRIIKLAMGTLATPHQLAGWVPFVKSAGIIQGQAQFNPLLDQMATAFVASDMFGNAYNNGIDVDPNSAPTAHEMQLIIQAALGTAATPNQITAWVNSGLTIDQVFVAFALGEQYTNASHNAIQQYLTSLGDAAANVNTAPIVGSTEVSNS